MSSKLEDWELKFDEHFKALICLRCRCAGFLPNQWSPPRFPLSTPEEPRIHFSKVDPATSATVAKLQTWLGKGGWFEVESQGPPTLPMQPASAMTDDVALTSFLAGVQQRAVQAGLDPVTLRPLQPQGETAGRQTSGWLRKARWAKTLQGVDLARASALLHDPQSAFRGVRPPAGLEEPSLADVVAAAQAQGKTRVLEAFKSAIELLNDDCLTMLACDDVTWPKKSARKSIDTSQNYRDRAAQNVGCLVGFAVAVRLLVRSDAIQAVDEGGEVGPTGDGDESVDSDEGHDGEGDEADTSHPQFPASLAPVSAAVASVAEKVDAFIQHIVADTVEDKHVTSLILALLRQPLEGVGRANLIVVYSAIQGVERERGHKWASGQKHGQFLVRLILGLRVTLWAVVEDVHGSIPLATRYKLLERLRQEVAVYGNGLAMSTLYGQRNYCLSLEAEASNLFRVVWAADGQSFTINGDLVRLTDLRAFAQGLVDETVALGRKLQRLGTATDDEDDFPLEQLRDVTGEETVGYSFVHDRHNEAIRHKSSMLRRILPRIASKVAPEEDEATGTEAPNSMNSCRTGAERRTGFCRHAHHGLRFGIRG
ncbi:hypothetical protein OC844_007275 [Tilletia horrida]|nr:hypothetical protein OC844_007275 [Tilletia horrida]